MDLLKSFISLLALINPVSAVPFFLGLTVNQRAAQKRRTMRVASILAVYVIAVSATLGERMIPFFGISTASLEVGGGIVMLLMTISLLNAQMGNARSHAEERDEAEVKNRAAVVCRWRFGCSRAADGAGDDQYCDRVGEQVAPRV